MPALQEQNFGLYYGWDLGESGFNLQMDGNIRKLSGVGVHLAVIDRNLATPPITPVDGDRYIVGPVAVDAWATHENDIAMWDNVSATWLFFPPSQGWRCHVIDEIKEIQFNGTIWTEYTTSAAPSDGDKGDIVVSGSGLNWVLDLAIKTTLKSANAYVVDMDLTAPPGAETAGDIYVPSATATGTWAGQEGKLAVYDGAAYIFVTPLIGWVIFVADLSEYYRYNGTAWVPDSVLAETLLNTAVDQVTTTLDLALARSFITNGQTVNTTLAFSNIPATGLVKVSYVFIQDAVGSRTLTFPAGFVWPSGVPPTVSSAINAEDEFLFTTRDGGVTWKGQVIGQAYS